MGIEREGQWAMRVRTTQTDRQAGRHRRGRGGAQESQPILLAVDRSRHTWHFDGWSHYCQLLHCPLGGTYNNPSPPVQNGT